MRHLIVALLLITGLTARVHGQESAPAGAAPADPVGAAGNADAAGVAATTVAVEEIIQRSAQTAGKLETFMKSAAQHVEQVGVSYEQADKWVKGVVAAVTQGLGSVQSAIDQVAGETGSIGEGEWPAAVPPDGTKATKRPAQPEPGTFVFDGFESAGSWMLEEWGDEGRMLSDGDRLHVEYTVGTKRKFAITKVFRSSFRVTSTDTIALDAENLGQFNARLALGMFFGPNYYESRPVSIQPGKNVVSFELGEEKFKSQETSWQYKAPLGDAINLEKLTFLIYASRSGKLVFDDLRLVVAQ